MPGVGALVGWGMPEERVKKYDEAIAQFQRALRIAPNRVETHINMGVALLGKVIVCAAPALTTGAWLTGGVVLALPVVLKIVPALPVLPDDRN